MESRELTLAGQTLWRSGGAWHLVADSRSGVSDNPQMLRQPVHLT